MYSRNELGTKNKICKSTPQGSRDQNLLFGLDDKQTDISERMKVRNLITISNRSCKMILKCICTKKNGQLSNSILNHETFQGKSGNGLHILIASPLLKNKAAFDFPHGQKDH